MSRAHVHFAKMDSDESTLDGFKHGTDVLVWIDLADALGGGLRFYRAENGVWLTPGDAVGVVATTHIARAAWRGPDGTYHALWALGPGGRGIDFTLHLLNQTPTIAAALAAQRDAQKRGERLEVVQAVGGALATGQAAPQQAQKRRRLGRPRARKRKRRQCGS